MTILNNSPLDNGISFERFLPASEQTRDLIAKYNEAGKINLLLASLFISEEGAQLGFLLSRLLDQSRDRSRAHKSFFSNSAVEGLSGAIKLVRHSAAKADISTNGQILVVDAAGEYTQLLNPTAADPANSLATGLHFVTDVEQAQKRLEERAWCAVLVVRDATAKKSDLRWLRTSAANKKASFILAETELSPSVGFVASELAPDVTVFGENLTDWQVPFGCFTATPEAYEVWNNHLDCLAHTSTFGGNGVATKAAIACLNRHGFVDAEAHLTLRQIQADYPTRARYFGTYVNPKGTRTYKLLDLDLDIAQARGARLRLADGREVIDATGCFGCSLRGHNPADIQAVLQSHDPEHDYFADLETALKRITGFDRAYPAVSGATAVDVGISLAMAAARSGRKIITFKGNYSGKTLIAMNLSQWAPLATGSDRGAFRPFYPHIEHIDPQAPDAANALEAALTGGDVGLVWFEIIQGSFAQAIPQALIDLVERHKKTGGYLIGVDEVLTGAWRTGADFLSHPRLLSGVDVVTVGKALSDMTFPIGIALSTAEVRERARELQPGLVERLESHYKNGLGAHIAHNGITQVETSGRSGHLLGLLDDFRLGLTEAAKRSRLLHSVSGSGNLLRANLNRNWFPFHSRSIPGQILESALSSYILEACGVLVLLMRFNMPILAEERDVRDAIRKLERVLFQTRPLDIYRYAAWQLLRFKRPKLARLILGRANPSRFHH